VKDATDKEVTFLMAGGKVVTYPLEKLLEDSRKLIKDALASRKEK